MRRALILSAVLHILVFAGFIYSARASLTLTGAGSAQSGGGGSCTTAMSLNFTIVCNAALAPSVLRG